MKDGFGRSLDRVGRAQPDARRHRGLDGPGLQQGLQRRILAHVGRRIALENKRPRIGACVLVGAQADFGEPGVAHCFRQPHHLERAVAFERSGRVIVNAFAWPRQQPRRGVVVVHDQVGVGFVALQRNADNHLAEGRPGNGVSAPKRLRAEKDMNPERAALAHQPIQQEGSRLRDFVVLDEELLELVNEQQRPGKRLGAARTFVSGHVLHAELAE